MALPINIEDLLNKNTPFHPGFIWDVQVDVQVKNAEIE